MSTRTPARGFVPRWKKKGHELPPQPSREPGSAGQHEQWRALLAILLDARGLLWLADEVRLGGYKYFCCRSTREAPARLDLRCTEILAKGQCY